MTTYVDQGDDVLEANRYIDEVCTVTGFTRDELLGEGREERLVSIRHRLMYVIWRETDLSLPAIGRLMHRHHTTVLHAVDKYRHRPYTPPRS